MYLNKLEEREAFWESLIREPRDEYMRLTVAVEGLRNAYPDARVPNVAMHTNDVASGAEPGKGRLAKVRDFLRRTRHKQHQRRGKGYLG